MQTNSERNTERFGVPFDRAVETLLKAPVDDVERAPRNIAIKGRLTAAGLKRLADRLRFEIAITIQDGMFVIHTGRDSQAFHEEDRAGSDAVETGPLDMHLHHKVFDGKTGARVWLKTPSTGDILMQARKMRLRGRTDLIAFIATPSGLVLYKQNLGEMPDPEKGIDDAYLEFEQKSPAIQKLRAGRKELSTGEKYALMEQYARESGAVVHEVPWEDAEGIEEILTLIDRIRTGTS